MSKEETINKLKEHVKNSIYKAERNISKINNDRLLKHTFGFSSERIKHLINNICSIDGTCYYEFGTYRGGTFASALFKNQVQGYAIDNFQFNPFEKQVINPKGWSNVEQGFKDNIKAFQLENKTTLIKSSFTTLLLPSLKHQGSVIYIDSGIANGDQIIDKVLYKFTDISVVIANGLRIPNYTEVIEESLKKHNVTIHDKVVLQSTNLEDNRSWWSGIVIWIIERQPAKNIPAKVT